jgi:PTH2 family peptidyl-tRNA hydrolase
MSNTKQVIVIRKDLKMRRGKEIAQGAHASMRPCVHGLIGAMLREVIDPEHAEPWEHIPLPLTAVERAWLAGSFRKVVCQVDSEAGLLEVYEAAKAAGLTVHLITDAGLTEFGGQATDTALAIGPDYDDRIDLVTKDLELY